MMMRTEYETVARNTTVDVAEECFISRKISYKQNSVKIGGRCSVNTSRDFGFTVPESHYYKYCSVLFSNNLEKEMKGLRDVLGDLDDYKGIRVSLDQFKTVIKSREIVLKETQDKMLRNLMYRNHQIKQGMEQYLLQYKNKFNKQDRISITLDQKSSEHASQSPRKITPLARPKTSQQISNNRFSKSLMMERPKRNSESELAFLPESRNILGVGQQRNEKQQRQEKQIFSNNNNKQSNQNSNTSNFANDFLFDGDFMTPPRPTFLDENRRQFAAAFGSKRKANSPNPQIQSRINEVKIIKDKLKLLNSSLAITCTKQQGYKKIYRSPRICSSIFI